MPNILVRVPGDSEGRILQFPEGTDFDTIRRYLGTVRANEFPKLAESVRLEIETAQLQRERRSELQGQFDRQQSLIFNPGARFIEIFGGTAAGSPGTAGFVRGVIGTVLDTEVAEEELGRGLSRFIQNPLTAIGAPTLGEVTDRAQVKFQELIGGNPKVPFIDRKLFPTPPPPLVNMLTGDFEEARQFAPMDLQRAIRTNIRSGALGQLASAGLDAIFPPEEFGSEFEEFTPDGHLETTAALFGSLIGMSPEFLVGARAGSSALKGLGGVSGASALNMQRLHGLGGIVGALSYADLLNSLVHNQIEFGQPGNFKESIDRMLEAIEEGGKGAVLGGALFASGPIAGRVFGLPAKYMLPSSIRGTVVGTGKFGAEVGTLATVPRLQEGGLPTLVDVADALSVVTAFHISNKALFRKVAERPDAPLIDHVVAVLVEARETPPLMLPPPPGQSIARIAVTPSTLFIEGPRERLVLDVDPRIPETRQLAAPDPATIAEGPGFVRQVEGQGAIAPAAAPIKRPGVPRAFEEQVVGRNVDALERLEARAEADAAGIEDAILQIENERAGQGRLEAPTNLIALPPPEPGTAGPGFTIPSRETGPVPVPMIGPVRRPVVDQPANVDSFPVGVRTPAVQALRDRRAAIEAEERRVLQIDPKGRIATRREFREFQEREDLAREPGIEEQVVEPQQVDAHKIGDEVSVMGKPSILANQVLSEGVRFELYNDKKLRDKGGAFRMVDVDSGQTVTVQSFKTFDAAEAAFQKAVAGAKPGQTEFDIEGIRRDAKTDAEAMDILVKTMRDIEDVRLEDPQNVREQKFRSIEAASTLSGEALGLRRAEARNLARQVVDAEYVAPGESIVDVLQVSEKDQTIRIRVRTNNEILETLDVPIEKHFTGVDRFVEADRRATAAIETAVSGRAAQMRLDGTMDKILKRLKDELHRLGEEEAGAFRNPFSGKKKGAKKEPGESIPPDIEQAARATILARRQLVIDKINLLQKSLRNHDLSSKERTRLEKRLAIAREELRIYNVAAQVAPIIPVDTRAELQRETFNSLRGIARNMGYQLPKNPTKSQVINAIESGRAEVQGRNPAKGSDIELANAAFKRINDENAAARARKGKRITKLLGWINKELSTTHPILKTTRQLMEEHPWFKDIFDRITIETELIRNFSNVGINIAKIQQKEIYGNLSRTERVLFDVISRLRADIALGAFDPKVKNLIPREEAVKALQNLATQDLDTFLKVDARVDIQQAAYKEIIEIAVEEGLLTREGADRMLELGDFLPTRLTELMDSTVVGIADPRTPRPGPTKRRGGGFEVENLPELETKDVHELRNIARQVRIRTNVSKKTKEELIEDIESAVEQREARLNDTVKLQMDYYAQFYSNLQRNRGAVALEAIAKLLPNNGVVTIAEQFRNSKGQLEFKKVETTEAIIQYRVEGETRGLVVDAQFADAFHFNSRTTSVDRWLPLIGMVSGTRFQRVFTTGAGNPFAAFVLFPRDVVQAAISTDTTGRSTYESFFPVAGEATLIADIMRALPGVVVRGPDVQRYLAHGGIGTLPELSKLFREGEAATDWIHSRIAKFTSAETDNRVRRLIQNVTVAGSKRVNQFYDGLIYFNSTAEISVRMAEFLRREKQIAKEKGVKVEDLEPFDVRAAALAAAERLSYLDGGNASKFLDELVLYSRVSFQGTRAPGRTVRETAAATQRVRKGKGTKADFKTMTNFGMKFGTLLAFPILMYHINKNNNEQGVIDLPAHSKLDIVYILPPELGDYIDENGIHRQSYIRLPVDEPLAWINSLGYNLAAIEAGDNQNVDLDSMGLAARRLLTMTELDSLPFHLKLFLEQFTNKSIVFENMKLFKGEEGGIPGAEVDPEKTSPAIERIGRILPFISPDRLQKSLDTSIPESVVSKAIGFGLNKTLGAGIEDVRKPKENLFLQNFPGGRQLLKSFEKGGSAREAGFDVDLKTASANNRLRGRIKGLFASSRNRNDGKFVNDDLFKEDVAAISSLVSRRFVDGIVERTMEFETVNALSSFPNVWRGILGEDPKIAAVKYQAARGRLTDENELVFRKELTGIKRSAIRHKTWWKNFLKEVAALEPEFQKSVKDREEHKFGDRGLELLEERGEIGPIPRESVFAPPSRR